MTSKDFLFKVDNKIEFSIDELKEICNRFIGQFSNISESSDGHFTRTFQVEGRWFRVYWTERLVNGEILIDYSLARVREMQSHYDYIRSLNIHDLARYLRDFSVYCAETNEFSLCELKHMLADYREDFK